MEEIRTNTHHVYPKRAKTKPQLMKEARAKRNVNPSRKIRHAMVEKWDPLMDLDHTAYHCCYPGEYYYDEDVWACKKCEVCTGKPAMFVQSRDWELTFDYP